MSMVNLMKTSEIHEMFEGSAEKLYRLWEDTGQTERLIGNLSGMQNVQRRMEEILEDMQQEYRALKQMEQCLTDMSEIVARYEEIIADHVEETREVISQERKIQKIYIPEELLKRLS